MSSAYSVDRQWSDVCLPFIKSIVGPHVLTVTPFVVDTQQAADLMVLTADPLKIACRVRRPGYAERYPDDITIRAWRDTNAKTEWKKIMDEGFGDWFFYGHADHAQRPTAISRWFLIDLHGLRWCFRQHGQEISDWVESRSNGDGTYFKTIYIPALYAIEPLIVIASSHPVANFHRHPACYQEAA